MARVNLAPFFEAHRVILRRGEVQERRVLLEPQQCVEVLGRRMEKDTIGPHHYPKARLELRGIAVAMGLEVPAVTHRVVRLNDCQAGAKELKRLQREREQDRVDTKSVFPTVKWMLDQTAFLQQKPVGWEKGFDAAFVIGGIWPCLNLAAQQSLVNHLDGRSVAELFSCSAANTRFQTTLFSLAHEHTRLALLASADKRQFDAEFIGNLPPDDQLALAFLMEKVDEGHFKAVALPMVVGETVDLTAFEVVEEPIPPLTTESLGSWVPLDLRDKVLLHQDVLGGIVLAKKKTNIQPQECPGLWVFDPAGIDISARLQRGLMNFVFDKNRIAVQKRQAKAIETICLRAVLILPTKELLAMQNFGRTSLENLKQMIRQIIERIEQGDWSWLPSE